MGTGIQAIIRLRCCCKRSEESPAAFKNDLPYNYGTGTTNTGRVLWRTDAIQPEHSVNYSYDSIYRLNQAVVYLDRFRITPLRRKHSYASRTARATLVG